MAVKIMIRRKVPPNKAKELTILLMKLRSLTVSNPAYISGETLYRIDDPEENMVISTWQSADDWRKWVLNPERIEIQDEIDILLGTATTYEIYGYKP